MRTSRILSFIAALAATGGACAVALAATSYSVKITLPADSIGPGHHFKLHATGTSPSSSQLTVYMSAKSCQSSSKAEVSHSANEILNKRVTHNYTSTKNNKASETEGTYYVCAYLTTGSKTRAHASKKWYDVTGGY